MPNRTHPLLSVAIALSALIALLAATPASADDNALLIQLQQDGNYRVWHSEGATHLPEPELLELEAGARPEGGEILRTSMGRAQAFEIKDSVVIELPDAPRDGRLLLDRDLCGALKVWHIDGTTQLTDDEMTELVLTALPDGGKRIKVGTTYAKGYSTRIGVIAVIWTPVARQPSGTKR